MNICPCHESLAAKDAIRSLKRGTGRFHAQRTVEAKSLTPVITFPTPDTFWTTFQAN